MRNILMAAIACFAMLAASVPAIASETERPAQMDPAQYARLKAKEARLKAEIAALREETRHHNQQVVRKCLSIYEKELVVEPLYTAKSIVTEEDQLYRIRHCDRLGKS